MRNKLLVFLVLHLVLGMKLTASNTDAGVKKSGYKSKVLTHQSFNKSPKKTKKIVAVLAPPSVVAGSSCGPGIVNLSATGGAGETIEWYTSQTAAVPVFTGNNLAQI